MKEKNALLVDFGRREFPANWDEYELIDSGGFEKLERFGKWVLRRPEPQAIWDKSLDEKQWVQLASATFARGVGGDPEKGSWQLKPTMPERWWISYPLFGKTLKFRLGLTSFKHVGLFPEQASNWDWIYEQVTEQKKKYIGDKQANNRDSDKNVGSESNAASKPRVLNLFAYTGGASLAACAAGADVTHVDSVKQVVTWSRENMEESRLDGIRWLVEDAFKFVQREARRGKKYDGILLDPPAYGRGPEGEKWLLEKQLNELMGLCGEILADDGFFLLNLYSMGFSAMVAENLIRKQVKSMGTELQKIQSGELYLPDTQGNRLPLGTFVRF
jgi:23S rRNA (cytosine1962-C5)-methyltransferase